MAKAQCPNCGAEYDTGGIATLCSHCQEPLPRPQTPPAPATPSSQRRPCVKCGEPLYPTELTCWKCGSTQVQRPTPTAGPTAAPPPATTYAPPPSVGAPPPPPTPYAGSIPPPAAPYAGAYSTGPSPEVQQRATTALVIGVIGLLCCNILGPVALFMGLSAKREGAEGTATAAIVLGALGCASMVLGIIWFIVLMATGASSGAFPTP
ncbi:MAG: DUF4190 domain-containing protein [Armatimonadetes bacterium]|nr:DUF4190 domain-containing protein [Armatimonadota bacterium]